MKDEDLTQRIRLLSPDEKEKFLKSMFRHMHGQDKAVRVRKILVSLGVDMPTVAISTLLRQGEAGLNSLVDSILNPGKAARRAQRRSAHRTPKTQTGSAVSTTTPRFPFLQKIFGLRPKGIPVIPVGIAILVIAVIFFGLRGRTSSQEVAVAETAPQDAMSLRLGIDNNAAAAAPDEQLPSRLLGEGEETGQQVVANGTILQSFTYPGLANATQELGNDANTPYFYLGYKVKGFLQPENFNATAPMDNFDASWSTLWGCVWGNFQPNLEAWGTDENTPVPFDLTQDMVATCSQ